TCTITNDDIAPAKLLVKKHVINDSGGTLTAGAFGLTLAADSFVSSEERRVGDGDETGVLVELPRGADYALTASFHAGPSAGSSAAVSSGPLLAGQFKTCTITNDDIAPAKLLVKKHVINDSGGTLTAGAFGLTLAADSFV